MKEQLPMEEDQISASRASLGPTRTLARFLARTSLADIPPNVIIRAKHLILDAFGCALLSAKLDWSQRAVNALRALDGEGVASVWGWKTKVPPTSAAVLNGTLVSGFELDDYHPLGVVHSGACSLPAVFATAELLGNVNGKRLLESAILGLEIGPRMGMAMGGMQLVNRGWHCGAVYGVMSGVAGAGKIRRLDGDQFEDAIGTAATHASGLMSAQFEAMVKRMHSGMAARSGVVSAALAEAGFTGIKRVIERDFGGYAGTFCGLDPFDLARLTDGLGEQWEVMKITVKPAYAAMAGTHSTIEAALKLRAQPGFRIDDIEEIRVGMNEAMLHHGGFQLERPATTMGAQMSHRYVVAVTLIDGSPSVPQFSPQRIDSDDVWKLIERIHPYLDAEIESRGEGGRWGSRLTVKFANGRTEEADVAYPRGGARFPLSNEEIVQKFDRLTALVTDSGHANELKETVLGLDHCKNVSELSALLAVDVRPPFDDVRVST
jgi:aconitate decarboxylase